MILSTGTRVSDKPILHRGLLEQRLERLQGQIQQLREEVSSVESLKAMSPLPSAGALRELEHSLRAEIMRLQQELNACEEQLRQTRDSIESQQGSNHGETEG